MSNDSSTTGTLPVFCHQCDGQMGLARHIARLVQDRHGAVAGVLIDLARDDVDQRRPVAVAVPGHDAAGLYFEAAHAHEVALERDLFVGEIDLGQHLVGDVLGGGGRGLGGVGAHLAGRAFAGKGGGGEGEAWQQR